MGSDYGAPVRGVCHPDVWGEAQDFAPLASSQAMLPFAIAAAGTTSEPTGLAHGQSVPPSSRSRSAGLSPHISVVTETQPPQGPSQTSGVGRHESQCF